MRLHFLATAGLLAVSLAAHGDTFVTYGVAASITEVYPNHSYLDTPLTFQATGTAVYDVELNYFEGVTLPVGYGDQFLGNINYPGYAPQNCYNYEYACSAFDDYGNFIFSFMSPGDEIPFPDGSFELNDVYGGGSVTGPLSTTPEPSSFALLGTGLLGMVGALRKRFA